MSNSQPPAGSGAHGIPIRNIWHMLLYACNVPDLTAHIHAGAAESAPSLDALFATVLMNMIQQRTRIGLGRGYVTASKRLRGVRGRLDFGASLKQHTFDHGEAVCDFQEYSFNEPRNQILRSTFVRLLQAGEFGPDQTEAEALRHRLRWLVRNLDGVDLLELDGESVRRQVLAQNDNDYRLMLSICELIVMQHMPLEAEASSLHPAVDREALTLHRIYERFVANFYRIHLGAWDVSTQTRLDWHAEESHEHLPKMIPDLILQERETGRVILLDTKFTASSLIENPWGKPVYDSSHLYQLYAYLRSQEQVSAAHRSARGILLYPAVRTRLSERVELQGHVIQFESVDLAAAWEEVERRLLEIVLSP